MADDERWFTMTFKVDAEARDPEEARVVFGRVHEAVLDALGPDRAFFVGSASVPEEVVEP